MTKILDIDGDTENLAPLDEERRSCPDCGSRRISEDGDLVEPLTHPDRLHVDPYFYNWWHCDECGYDWRYQDEDLNP